MYEAPGRTAGLFYSCAHCQTAAEAIASRASRTWLTSWFTAARLEELEKIYRKSQQTLVDAAKQRGEKIIVGDQGLGLTLDEYKAWILEWATYNEVASHHHGYRVD